MIDFPEAMWAVFSPSHGLPKRKEDIMFKEPRPIVSSFISNNFADDEEYAVSSSPTRDLCYGNMERLAYKKYCHSEMPSISLEPTEMPTNSPHHPQVGEPWSNSDTPSILPSLMLPSSLSPSFPSITLAPSPFPHHHNPTKIGMCHGDCNTPSDCDEGLYCYQRMNFEAVPGCPGTEWDESRTDYCTNTTNADDSAEVPSPLPTEDSFRLKLYWNSSYWWQESNEEKKWCISCPRRPGVAVPTCHAGDLLSVHFQTEPWGNHSDDSLSLIIQVVNTTLCLERHDTTNVTLATCNTTNDQQQWTSPQAPWTLDESFEIIHRPRRSDDLCLTIHHHPKLGDVIKMIPCPVSRHDNSSLWVMF